jgi:hypothetical protein
MIAVATRSLNIASPDCAEQFFAGRAARCVDLHHAGSLPELRQVLERHRAHGRSKIV